MNGNLYSVNENLLLYWMELVYKQVAYPDEKRLKSFDKDLNNGIVFQKILEKYVGYINPV
jgi:hypothetical protein